MKDRDYLYKFYFILFCVCTVIAVGAAVWLVEWRG